MSTEPILSEITDRAVKDISKKVARMDMLNADAVPVEEDGADSCSLVTTAKGDYELTIVFCAGFRVMRAIAENMKRGESANEEDIAIYTKEFFNILCGHVVSALNRAIHASARFGIPQFLIGPFRNDQYNMQAASALYYQSCYGPVKILQSFKPLSPEKTALRRND